MARIVLGDITEEFKNEVPECGSASKCYCVTCVKTRSHTFKLFASWRQVVRNKKPEAVPNLEVIATKYASSHTSFNAVVEMIQYYFNCNGLFAADIATPIIMYTNAPTAQMVATEYLSCNKLRVDWIAASQVLTKWTTNEINLITGEINYMWLYIPRQVLFKIFKKAWYNALMSDVKDKFNALCHEVVRRNRSTFVNKVFYISPRIVFVADQPKKENGNCGYYTDLLGWAFYENLNSINNNAGEL